MANRLITGLSPQREQQTQERLVTTLSNQAEFAIRREITRAMLSIYKDGEESIELHQTQMFNLVSRMYHNAFNLFAGRLWGAIRKSNDRMQQKKDVPATPQFDLSRQLWIRNNAAQRVTQIAGTTLLQSQELIRQATEQAIEQGLDEEETAALIRQFIDEQGGQLSILRSRVISRTETHAASNASQQMAAKASGLPLQKEWIASISERTRDSHALANGQKVGLDAPFVVGVSLMMQPGDTSAPAEEVINCRCVVGYSL